MSFPWYVSESIEFLMRFKPSPMASASLIESGSPAGFSTVHSQKDAMSDARSLDIFDATKPDSMMGMSAAAALRRLISGVARGIFVDM